MRHFEELAGRPRAPPELPRPHIGRSGWYGAAASAPGPQVSRSMAARRELARADSILVEPILLPERVPGWRVFLAAQPFPNRRAKQLPNRTRRSRSRPPPKDQTRVSSAKTKGIGQHKLQRCLFRFLDKAEPAGRVGLFQRRGG